MRESVRRRPATAPGRRPRRYRRGWVRRRGVSAVVATIMILAMTVVLFASIFVALRYFPKPPPQPSETLKAYVGITGKTFATLSIAYVNGPPLGSSTQIYAVSQAKPTDIQPPGGRAYFTIGTGIGGLSTWQIGQTWTIQLASYESSALSLPDNLTVSVVSNGLLIFRASVPGLSPTFPPVFTNYGTTPGTPTAGKQFSINVQVQGVNTVRWVNATLSDIPGFTSASVAMSANGTGEWSYVVASGKTTGAVSGVVYYAVVSATDSQFLTSQVVVPVVFH